MTTNMIDVNVVRHADGKRVGVIEMDAAEWGRYATGTHSAYQWPEGVAEAGDVLDDDAIEEMGLTSKTVVWLDA